MRQIFSRAERERARMVDAERSARLSAYAAQLEERIRADREYFRPEFACAALGIAPGDREDALQRTYELALERTYRDEVITERERAALNWLAARLELDDEHRKSAEIRVGGEVFERVLDTAMRDGRIEFIETAKLDALAKTLGQPLPTLISTYFSSRGAVFLRALFESIIRDGEISAAEWEHLGSATDGLGLPRETLMQMIGGAAESFVDQLLADARAAGVSPEATRKALGSLLDRLPLSQKFRTDVDTRIAKMGEQIG